MAWLHRWAGLVSGWAAFAIFLTGTLALFDTELTRWMQPETAIIPDKTSLTPTAIEHAQQILRDDERAGAPPSFLLLPDARTPHYASCIMMVIVLLDRFWPRTQASQFLFGRQKEGIFSLTSTIRCTCQTHGVSGWLQ
ncbi:PepSY domain-containing protein [Acetobacter fabarum]|uniref:PepSY domain-containing protein n=1 Tax=Acetobacter fabarum TaxID=483199 RepID=UPI00209E8097|nr:PepSY domain-containing protein [Acetobacter fabarum]